MKQHSTSSAPHISKAKISPNDAVGSSSGNSNNSAGTSSSPPPPNPQHSTYPGNFVTPPCHDDSMVNLQQARTARHLQANRRRIIEQRRQWGRRIVWPDRPSLGWLAKRLNGATPSNSASCANMPTLWMPTCSTSFCRGQAYLKRPIAKAENDEHICASRRSVPTPGALTQELADGVDHQADETADDGAVDADELQVPADLQFEALAGVLRIPGTHGG